MYGRWKRHVGSRQRQSRKYVRWDATYTLGPPIRCWESTEDVTVDGEVNRRAQRGNPDNRDAQRVQRANQLQVSVMSVGSSSKLWVESDVCSVGSKHRWTRKSHCCAGGRMRRARRVAIVGTWQLFDMETLERPRRARALKKDVML